jgi:hypothetical protein
MFFFGRTTISEPFLKAGQGSFAVSLPAAAPGQIKSGTPPVSYLAKMRRPENRTEMIPGVFRQIRVIKAATQKLIHLGFPIWFLAHDQRGCFL